MPRRKNQRRITTTKRKRTVLERIIEVNGYKLNILAVVKQEGVQIKFENCIPEVKNIKRRTTLFALQRLTIIRDRVTYT